MSTTAAVPTLDPNKNHFRLMTGPDGDIPIQWNPDNRDEVSIAKAAFEEAKKKGMLIYRTDKKGEKGKIMKDWDPEAERIIATPAVVGG